MKKITYLIAILMLFSITNSKAQESADASATATVVAPIAISKTTDMNFGNVAVSSLNSGTVVLAPAGTRTTTGDATTPATSGTVSAASFSITGESGYTYAITLPSSAITLEANAGANSMTIGSFTSDPDATGTLTGGAETVNVGATLNLSAGQAAGVYNSTSALTVTVNYN
ncbi:DUF4402 domain-containing protein [Arenibacter algicola]|uniref:DUF4402 domain-containing protein n=1 Tax=Arenibacter algicola TaxID=616991 RepID=A0A221V1D5_9FLAO|nr:DUF4402 domain-containing protein [Arenibacter algicola]ASO07427.1 hypothetical protein AREALGSMS7_04021 [Arenibacter algicola]